MDAPIYLDCHATTPCDPRVVEAMIPTLDRVFGNPDSRAHAFGRAAHALVEAARADVAALIGAAPDEIVFTSGATESDQLAILGVVRASSVDRPHVITQRTEHRAVLDAVRSLELHHAEVSLLDVDPEGRLDPAAVEAALRPNTVLVSVMLANNEIGTAQDVAAIGAICRARGIVFHTDASQGRGYLPLDVRRSAIDLASLSSHKIYGPKGVGALFVRKYGPALAPLVPGGGQERGLRSGTKNVTGIVGFGEAARILRAEGEGEAVRLARLRDRLRDGLLGLPGTHVHGSSSQRHPGNLHLRFECVTSEALLLALGDTIAFSSGSACATASPRPSHVLLSLGLSEEEARSAVRFGVGRFTTEAQVDAVIARFRATVEELRSRSPLWQLRAEGKSPRDLGW